MIEVEDRVEKSFSLKKAAKSERKESKKKYVEPRRKKYGKKKPEPIVEDVVMIEVEDRAKESNLQTEVTKEQEYQDMINMLYNNPELWEQHHQSLQHQPALHQCDSEMDQHVMKHNAPMYFIKHQHVIHQHVIQQQQPQQLQQLHHSQGLEQEFHHEQPLKTSTPTAMFLSETSSDYFSDSNPSSEKFNFYDTALSWAWESEEPYSA